MSLRPPPQQVPPVGYSWNANPEWGWAIAGPGTATSGEYKVWTVTATDRDTMNLHDPVTGEIISSQQVDSASQLSFSPNSTVAEDVLGIQTWASSNAVGRFSYWAMPVNKPAEVQWELMYHVRDVPSEEQEVYIVVVTAIDTVVSGGNDNLNWPKQVSKIVVVSGPDE